MKYKIPFIRPSFPSSAEISEDFSAIVASNWYTNFGPYERRFRDEVSSYVGGDVHVVTIANATLGIELAVFSLLGLPSDDKKEVLVQSFTFAAGPEVLVRCGFKPVFIDVKHDTWQPDFEQARAYIKDNKEKVAGVLLCNTFGVGNQDIEAWETLAKEYKLPLIIDTAAGFGSQYFQGEYVGLRGDCEIFSLHATKPFCVGEGGLILTRSAALAKKLRQLENFGFNDDHEIASLGTNAKLQELNCAIGLRQLRGLKDKLAARQRSLTQLQAELGNSFSFQSNDHLSSVPFASVLMPTTKARDAAIERLKGRGVEAKMYYRPLHEQTVLMSHCEQAGTLAVTEDIASRVISLPLYETMNDTDLSLIIKTMTMSDKA